MKKKIIIGLFAAGLCSAAFAQNEHSKELYGQFGLGAYFNHSHSQTSPSVTGTVGYGFNKDIAAQASVNYMSNNQKNVLVEGIWNFTNNTKSMLYVAIGGSYMDMTTNLFGLDAGLGVKYDFASNAYISADYRYLQSFSSKAPNGSMFTVGIGLYFGSVNNSSAYGAAMPPVLDDQQSREDEYHAAYTLPKNVLECQTGNSSEIARESIGCYTVDSDKVTMHLDTKFTYSSYALNTKAKAAINNLINFMNEYDIKKVILEGFASQGKTGPEFAQYNQQLSVNRAQAVKSYVISKGIDTSNIEVAAYGYTRPLVPNTTKENQSINQRVEASIPVPLKAQ